MPDGRVSSGVSSRRDDGTEARGVSLEARLAYRVEFDLPGVVRDGKPVRVSQAALAPRSGEKWFAEFRERAVSAIGRRWCPVYRIADGEFSFCVGWRPHRGLGPRELAKSILWRLGLYDPSRRPTCWGESYSESEQASVAEGFARDLREIARHGALAVYFGAYGKVDFEEYRKPMCRWLEIHGVELNEANYVPFWFVLTALASSGWEEFIVGRRLLVVTSLDGQAQVNVAKTLHEMGAGSVQFALVSATKAMLSRLDVSEVRPPIDVVLVGAGIGSANVLCQLREFQTLCLDVGGYLKALAEPTFVPHGLFSPPRRAAAPAEGGK